MRTPVGAGAVTALIVGGLMIAIVIYGGELAPSMIGIIGLTIPLVVAGALYGWLIQTGRMRLGFGPGIVFWIGAFPAARLVQEFMLGGGGTSQGFVGFVVFQAMVGGAFGLGFFLLHNQIWTLLHRGQENADTEEQSGATG